ncbi:TPA: single-stranded DNA-binding protein [Streptococcus suis]|nr:single-stranded DNA-binding protein [Streptococcus suis]HEL2334955.1 single-stranded DNA-binding protein [Streptococcus suis]HEM4293690.1 single-stranded DNA-binding protein [Streptococcus suis]
MINNVVLVGRLTRDVELRYTPNNVAVGAFTRAYKDIERQEIEIETLKDKCVDLMLENADYVWDEIARETSKKRSNTRKWRAK